MTQVILGKSRVREICMPGSVRAKAEWLSYSTITGSHEQTLSVASFIFVFWASLRRRGLGGGSGAGLILHWATTRYLELCLFHSTIDGGSKPARDLSDFSLRAKAIASCSVRTGQSRSATNSFR